MCLMSDIINLNKFRKARKRQDSESRAAGNRVLHGLSKAEKVKAAKRASREQNDLDGKKLETPSANRPDDEA
jgi:hypothetical protein